MTNDNPFDNPIIRSILTKARASNQTLGPLPPILRSNQNQGIKLRIAQPRPSTPVSLSYLFRAKDEPDLIKRINSQINKILKTKLNIADARVVPFIEDIAHIEEAKKVETSVLHIDIRNSSSLVDELSPEIALKVYQIFHSCVTETLRYKDGKIRTFAGDRIVALFNPGKEKLPRTTAVETALLIDKMLTGFVNPILAQNNIYPLEYGIGIDYGLMLAGRVGKYGKQNNDIVWAGNAMNYASKLADFGNGIFLSQGVYDGITDNIKNDINHFWSEKKESKLGTFYQVMNIFSE